jgi:aminoglycoside phosphotransferase (APT) family kinase protein
MHGQPKADPAPEPMTEKAQSPERALSRHRQLTEILRDEYGHLGIGGLREIGQGLDARVYRADSAALGPVAVRVPHDRWLSSGNESGLDTRRQLRQDYQLSRHLRAHGLPVPEVFVLHTDDSKVDFTISRFVVSDGSDLPDEAFGAAIRAIHEVPVPEVDLVCMDPPGDIDAVLAERIGQRLRNLAAITDLGIGLPDIAAVLSADRGDPRRRLLHMDLRPENILTQAGRPAAILDWSNALVGDPALDLARAAEYGSLTPAGLAAYGDPGTFGMNPDSPRQAVYRLDTAVMLSHVFLDGAPDHARARHYIDRTRTLCSQVTRTQNASLSSTRFCA